MKIPAWLLAVGLLLTLPHVLRAGECTQSEGSYMAQHYVVKNIRLEAPLDIFHFANRTVNLDQLPLKAQRVVNGNIVEKGEFNNVAFATSGTAIGNEINGQMGSNVRLQFAVVLPELANCDDAAHNLDAVFKVYNLNVPASLAQPLDLVVGPPIQSSSNKNQGSLFQSLAPQFTGGYDTNRHLYAGGKATYQGSTGGLLDTMTIEGSASSTSTLFRGSLKGSRNWKRGPVQRADWLAAYSLSDLPSTSFQLHESKVTGRFSGSSPTLFGQALLFYFGAAIDAGNQHSNGAATVPANVLLKSQVGNLKGYLGAAWNHGPNILQASYGIQAGKSTPGVHVDYLKHLFYAMDSLRLLPQDHRPLTLEMQFGAGRITGDGPVPLAERFFGGNLRRDFIPSDPWRIPTDPFIRSFPTNSLSITAPGAVGGTSFFSVNATLSYALWGKPLVPVEILPEIEPKLNAQLTTFENALKDSYVADLADFKSVETDLSHHGAEFAELREKVGALKAHPGISQEISDQVDVVLGDLDEVDSSMAALGKRDAATDPVGPVLLLVSNASGIGQIITLADDLKDLEDLIAAAGMSGQQSDFQMRETAIRNLRTSFFGRFNAINQDAAKARAKANLNFSHSVLNQLLHALNIYSIAPVVLLDAARLGPESSLTQSGMRYGVGPAVRLSLLNVDLTLGYSVNPNPQLGERRGAPVVNFEISNIFR